MVRSLVAIVAALVLLAGLFLSLRPDSRVGEARERRFELSVEDGEAKPGKLSVDEGDRVTLSMESDVPLKVHVHGYDLEREVGAGGTVSATFEAGLTGRFGIEDHRSGRELGVLLVHPR